MDFYSATSLKKIVWVKLSLDLNTLSWLQTNQSFFSFEHGNHYTSDVDERTVNILGISERTKRQIVVYRTLQRKIIQ